MMLDVRGEEEEEEEGDDDEDVEEDGRDGEVVLDAALVGREVLVAGLREGREA